MPPPCGPAVSPEPARVTGENGVDVANLSRCSGPQSFEGGITSDSLLRGHFSLYNRYGVDDEWDQFVAVR